MRDRCPNFLPSAKEYADRARHAAEKVRQEIIAVTARQEPATFANTILWLEHVDDDFRECAEDFFYLLGVHGTPDFQQAAEEMGLLSTQLANDIALNEHIFARVAKVYEQEKERRTGDDARLLQKMYDGFVRAGAALPQDQKTRYQAIEERLTTLTTQFAKNVLDATNALSFTVEHEQEITGVPPEILQKARQRAEKEEKSGWIFGADQPTVMALLAHAPSSALRQRIVEARARLATAAPYDNRPIVHEIASLRQEKAQLLGYSDWAAYQLAVRMAQSVETIEQTFVPWKDRVLQAVERDLMQIATFAEKDRATLTAWDYPYFVERYQECQLSINEAEVRAYLPVHSVLPAWLALLGEWYGLIFTKGEGYSVYHPSVEVYEVRTVAHETVGVLYVDLFARPEKRAGAWMSELRTQEYRQEERIHPVVGIAMNVFMPEDGSPPCFSHDDLVTLFHESGHALHGLLSNVAHRSLAGTNVAWDFVELPSQFTENFAYVPEILARVSSHKETGEAMPEALASRLADSLTFQAGVQFARQLAFVQLDLAWHAGKALPQVNQQALEQFEAQAVAPYRAFPPVPGGLISTAFAHIFAGDYSAGYYSYRWAEMLDADAFAHAKTSRFAPEVFAAFAKEILSKGDSAPAHQLYHAFRGQAPDPEALLTRLAI